MIWIVLFLVIYGIVILHDMDKRQRNRTTIQEIEIKIEFESKPVLSMEEKRHLRRAKARNESEPRPKRQGIIKHEKQPGLYYTDYDEVYPDNP